LFLETAEPGIVPAPGTSVGGGLARGLEAFVDKERRNKVMVLVSDGEDLEGDVEEAVRRAKEEGVIVHTVGVGTEAGQPVPELDADGRVVGYKRDESGNPVVSRLNMATLESIARGTGGKVFRITPADSSLGALAATIEGMERKALAAEYSYRRKERYQVPLAIGLAGVTLALLLPPPPLRRPRAGRKTLAERSGRAAAVTLLLAGTLASPSGAQPPAPPVASTQAPATAAPASRSGTLLDELLLRPRRATEEGRAEYARGNHPQALSAFERAAAARPQDLAARFNVADGLYKNGKYQEAAELFRALGGDARSRVAAASRFNLGNALYQTKYYDRAIQAYRDALKLAPGDESIRRNLELALRARREQEEQQKRQQDRNDQQSPQNQQQNQQQRDQQGRQQNPQPNQENQQQNQQPKDQQNPPDQKQQDRQKSQQGQSPAGGDQKRPLTPQEREDQRFREATGMPKERAMQLLDALQQNEEAEQKKLLALKRAQKKKGKDW
jgi:YD repeat-containing protein